MVGEASLNYTDAHFPEQHMAQKNTSAKLDVGGPDPLYKQVEKRILQCLAEGEWKPGEQLPTESQLAERFGVAVFTIRAGISELAAANVLVRKQGKGTFVARHSRSRQRYQYSHIHDAAGNQVLPSRELVSFVRSPAKATEVARLRLPHRGSSVVCRLRMLSLVDGEAVATLDIVLPGEMFRDLTAAAVRGAQENLYAVYQDVCGVNVIRIEERVHAGIATDAEATTLGLPPGNPVLRVERIAYTYQEAPVEFRVRVFDGTRFHYRSLDGGI